MSEDRLPADKAAESDRERPEKRPEDWLVVPELRFQSPNLTLARSRERARAFEGTNRPARSATGVDQASGFRLFESEAYEPGPYIPGQQKVRELRRRIDSTETGEVIDHREAWGPDGHPLERQSLSYWFRHEGGDGFMGIDIDYHFGELDLDEKLKSVTTTIRIPGQTDIDVSLSLYWSVDGRLIGRDERQEDHGRDRKAVRGAKLNADGRVDTYAATYADPGNDWDDWWSSIDPEDAEIIDPNTVIDKINARIIDLRTKHDPTCGEGDGI